MNNSPDQADAATDETPATTTTKRKRGSRTKAERAATFDDALLAAQRSIRNVPKNGRNKFHKYDYTTAEDMIGATRHALHEQGLVAERVGCSIVPVPMDCIVQDKDGSQSLTDVVWMLRSMMRVSHAPTGELREGEFDYPICPEKGRPLDKAASASMSTSLSYWLRDLLQVPRCDSEVDVGRHEVAERQQPPPRAQRARRPAVASVEPPVIIERAQQPQRARGAGARVDSNERIAKHYTGKLRNAVKHGLDAVERVADEIAKDRNVIRGSTTSQQLREEYQLAHGEAELAEHTANREAVEAVEAGERWGEGQ